MDIARPLYSEKRNLFKKKCNKLKSATIKQDRITPIFPLCVDPLLIVDTYSVDQKFFLGYEVLKKYAHVYMKSYCSEDFTLITSALHLGMNIMIRNCDALIKPVLCVRKKQLASIDLNNKKSLENLIRLHTCLKIDCMYNATVYRGNKIEKPHDSEYLFAQIENDLLCLKSFHTISAEDSIALDTKARLLIHLCELKRLCRAESDKKKVAELELLIIGVFTISKFKRCATIVHELRASIIEHKNVYVMLYYRMHQMLFSIDAMHNDIHNYVNFILGYPRIPSSFKIYMLQLLWWNYMSNRDNKLVSYHNSEQNGLSKERIAAQVIHHALWNIRKSKTKYARLTLLPSIRYDIHHYPSPHFYDEKKNGGYLYTYMKKNLNSYERDLLETCSAINSRVSCKKRVADYVAMH
jgi:hypothetical protein